MREFKLLIDGRLVDGASTMDVINPATGSVLARCPRASAAPRRGLTGRARVWDHEASP